MSMNVRFYSLSALPDKAVSSAAGSFIAVNGAVYYCTGEKFVLLSNVDQDTTGEIKDAEIDTTTGVISFKNENNVVKFTLGLSPYIAAEIGKLDGSATIASVADGIVTIKAGVAETDGKIANDTNADITLAKVATTGKASDVALDKTLTIGQTKIDTVQGAISGIASAFSGLVDATEGLVKNYTDAITVNGVAQTDQNITIDGSNVNVDKNAETTETVKAAIERIDGAAVKGVQVNGADLTATGNKVNITVVTGTANGTIAVNGADVAVKGLGSAAYTDSDAYDAAGKAQELINALGGSAETTNNGVKVGVVTSKGEVSSVTVDASGIVGTADDATTANTINGAKNYAKGLVDALGTAAKADVATTDIVADSTDTNLVSGKQVAAFVKDQVKDIAGAMHFEGVMGAVPTSNTNYVAGDLILVGAKEYVFNGKTWVELGDESTHELKGVAAKLIAELDAEVVNESGNVKVTVTETDGKISEVAVDTSGLDTVYDALGAADAAKSEVIGASGDASTTNTIYGAKKYADEAAADAISKIAEATQTGSSNGVEVSVKTAAGSVSSVSVTAPNFGELYDAKGAAAQALTDANSYTDTAVAALDAKVEDAGTKGVKVSVAEADGKLTSVSAELVWLTDFPTA